MICRDLPGRPYRYSSCLASAYGKTTEPYANKKNVFRNDSPEGATDTSGSIIGDFEIFSLE